VHIYFRTKLIIIKRINKETHYGLMINQRPVVNRKTYLNNSLLRFTRKLTGLFRAGLYDIQFWKEGSILKFKEQKYKRTVFPILNVFYKFNCQNL